MRRRGAFFKPLLGVKASLYRAWSAFMPLFSSFRAMNWRPREKKGRKLHTYNAYRTNTRGWAEMIRMCHSLKPSLFSFLQPLAESLSLIFLGCIYRREKERACMLHAGRLSEKRNPSTQSKSEGGRTAWTKRAKNVAWYLDEDQRKEERLCLYSVYSRPFFVSISIERGEWMWHDQTATFSFCSEWWTELGQKTALGC